MPEPAGPRWNGFSEPPNIGADVLRYALAAVFVLCAAAALTSRLARSAPADSASEVDSAVMIDLPPAETSSRPAGDDGPAQQAAQANIAQPIAQPTSEPAPKPDDPSPVDTPPSDPQPEVPPPPVAPEPAAVLPQPPEAAPPPVAPPPSPAEAAQAETAPSGADAKVETDADRSDQAVHHASARLITIWQKSLMQRLEGAKHALGHATRGIGTVGIAFAIDSGGHLVSERVAHSSGSAGLDDVALALVKHAAPFPVPPTGTGAKDLSFVVPVVFKR